MRSMFSDSHPTVSEIALAARLFRLDEGWAGPVRLLSFLGGGHPLQTLSVRARMGSSVQLESIEVLDLAALPDGVIRLRVNWQALQRIDRLYIVCAHIFSDEGIVAQHYDQPAGSQRPTNTWRPGETVVDQFALRIASTAEPGFYRLRVGLYDMDSRAWLPVQSAGGEVAEGFVGGEIQVR